jgi:hypothetical protein
LSIGRKGKSEEQVKISWMAPEFGSFSEIRSRSTALSADARQERMGAGHGAGQSGPLERFSYDDAIVRKFLVAMLVWGIVGMLVGLIIALQLALPYLRSPRNPEPNGVRVFWLQFGLCSGG